VLSLWKNLRILLVCVLFTVVAPIWNRMCYFRKQGAAKRNTLFCFKMSVCCVDNGINMHSRYVVSYDL